jgi:heme-degrading monooxygenase HmoA
MTEQRSTSPETKVRPGQGGVAFDPRAPGEAGPIYRVDKFAVPDHARAELIERIRRTHELLRTLPGFVQDAVLEQTGGPGEFNFVTIAVWDSEESFEHARATLMARYEATGFSPQEFIARAGIQADLATYRQIDA